MSIWHPKTTWTDDQDAFLKAKCELGWSYSTIAKAFAQEFPTDVKSRNAMLGRACRKGFDKAPADNKVRKQRAKTGATITRRKHQQESQVAFMAGEDPLLRGEGDRGIDRSRKYARKLGAGNPVVAERKKGNLPAIIEQSPTSSIPMADACKLSCMWPTNFEATEVCGAKATVGSYCARHASSAYRIMPTRKRNIVRHKEDREHLVRIDGSHRRGELDPDGAWLSEALRQLDEVTIDGVDEGNHPLFIPHFLGIES